MYDRMRIPSGNIPIQPLQYLWERHMEIARRLVAGDRPIDIAHEIGMTTTRLSIIMNSPLFQAHLQELSKQANKSAVDIQGRLHSLSPHAMSILEAAVKEKVDGISPAFRVKVAQDVLDRTGHGALQKSVSMSAVLTAEDIQALKERRKIRTVPQPQEVSQNG